MTPRTARMHWYRDRLDPAQRERYDQLLAYFDEPDVDVDGSNLTVWDCDDEKVARFVLEGIGYLHDLYYDDEDYGYKENEDDEDDEHEALALALIVLTGRQTNA